MKQSDGFAWLLRAACVCLYMSSIGACARNKGIGDISSGNATHAAGTSGAPVTDAATGEIADASLNDSDDSSVADAGAVDAGSAVPTTDAGNLADPSSLVINMDDFTVAAGAEVFMCQDFDNPFGGEDVAIAETISDMTKGSHHLHVFYGVGTPRHDHAEPCENPNEFRPLLHIGTLPHEAFTYPTGMAAKLKGRTGLRLQVHYLNTTDGPLAAHVSFKLTKTDPANVQQWVAQIHFNRTYLMIPPGNGTTVTTSCKIPSTFGPIGLITGISHMHSRGTHFVAETSTGVSLLETTNWDDPPATEYPTPIMMNPGDAIKWSCTYNNTTNQTLTYGDSAKTNEMCIYIARFFSSPNGDDLECETPFASTTALVKSTY